MAELGSTKIYGNQTVTGDQNVLGDISVEGTVDGRNIALDGSKLDGISSGAEVNQNAFSNIAVSGQTTVAADGKTDTLTLVAGTNVSITTDATNDTVTINANDTSVAWSEITDKPTYDNYNSWTAKDHDGTTYSVTSGDVLWFKEGGGMDVNFTADDVLTISHSDTSSQASVNNSGRTYIQDITLDGYGHITGIVSATDSDAYTGTVTSVATGTGLTGGTITGSGTISHADTSTQASLTALTGANVVSDIDLDGMGHVTSLSTRAMTLADLGYTGETNATADQTASEILTAIKTVDGSGSGLDADTVDGLQASQFLRSDASDTVAPGRQISFYSNDAIESSSGDQASLEVFQDTPGADAFMQFHVGGDYAAYFGLDGSTNDFSVGGWSMGNVKYKIWHAGNDGSGSGLDADLLDGNHASAFAAASHNHDATYVNTSGDTMTGALYLAGTGTNGFSSGTGDGASYTTYNVTETGWWGKGYTDYSGAVNGVYNYRTGTWDVKGGYKVNGATVWHAGNDGAGSGLDADLLDGQHASAFASVSHTHSYLPLTGGTLTGDLTVNGGDIILGGTGRIQGIDSIIADTDAVSKGYVDNAIVESSGVVGDWETALKLNYQIAVSSSRTALSVGKSQGSSSSGNSLTHSFKGKKAGTVRIQLVAIGNSFTKNSNDGQTTYNYTCTTRLYKNGSNIKTLSKTGSGSSSSTIDVSVTENDEFYIQVQNSGGYSLTNLSVTGQMNFLGKTVAEDLLWV